MTTNQLRIGKWIAGLFAFALPTITFPLMGRGYSLSGAAMIGLAFAIPPMAVFHLAQNGVYLTGPTRPRTFLFTSCFVGLVLGPVFVVACVLGHVTWLAWFGIYGIASDACWMFWQAKRMAPRATAG